QLCIEPAKLGQQLLVERQLIRTDRAPVFRIEGEDDRLAAELRQRDGLIGCRWKLEVRCLGAGREWGRTLYRLLHQMGICSAQSVTLVFLARESKRGAKLSVSLEPISFEKDVKPLFREGDRRSMKWA